MSPATTNESALEKMWDAVKVLKPTSTDADFDKAASFFTEDTSAYINAMLAPPAEGRAGLVAALRVLVTYWALDAHRIGKVAASPDGKVVMREMHNRLLILGEPIDPFHETEVAEFDEQGLISKYRLYTDSAPVMQILIKKGAVPAPKYD